MLIRLRPGTDRESLREALLKAETSARNAHARNGPDISRYQEYMRWAEEASWLLRGLVSPADIESLVQTRVFWALLGSPEAASAPEMSWLSDDELQARAHGLLEANAYLEQVGRRWGPLDAPWEARFVVADTNVFLHHPQRLDQLDLAADLDCSDSPVHLVIPMVVLDELDKAKDRGQGEAKTNARTTIRLLDTLLSNPADLATIRPVGYSPLDPFVSRGAFTAELLPDPPRHTRLERPDDEIVDRASAVAALAGRPVTVVTGDFGMATRARLAHLPTVLLNWPASQRGPRGQQPRT
jgi:rRNA-processing protein FCF1